MESKSFKKYFNNKFNTLIKTIENIMNIKFEQINKNLYNLNSRMNGMNRDIEDIKKYIYKKPIKKTVNIVNKKNDDNKNKDKPIKIVKINNLKSEQFIRDIKIENFNFDTKDVKKFLDLTNLISDTNFFKYIYLNNIKKEFYPIRNLDNKKSYQYRLNNNWVDDTNGEYIKLTVMKNIQNCYLKTNQFNLYENNTEQFLRNQEHINELSDPKYQKKWLNNIKPLIKI